MIFVVSYTGCLIYRVSHIEECILKLWGVEGSIILLIYGASGGLGICVSSTNFQNNNICGPQQPPTERVSDMYWWKIGFLMIHSTKRDWHWLFGYKNKKKKIPRRFRKVLIQNSLWKMVFCADLHFPLTINARDWISEPPWSTLA